MSTEAFTKEQYDFLVEYARNLVESHNITVKNVYHHLTKSTIGITITLSKFTQDDIDQLSDEILGKFIFCVSTNKDSKSVWFLFESPNYLGSKLDRISSELKDKYIQHKEFIEGLLASMPPVINQ